MRTPNLPKDFFAENRKHFASQLEPRSAAVLVSNDVMPTNADGTLPFVQNSDLYYLTGIAQEETALLVAPDAVDPKQREVLFIRECTDHVRTWEGPKMSKEEAKEQTGIENVHYTGELNTVLKQVMKESDNLYLNDNDHLRSVNQVPTRERRYIKECRERFPLHTFRRAAPILHRQRLLKKEPELAMLREACDITEQGFRRVLGFLKPGVAEYELEAEYLHEFIRRKSRGFAYSPIIGSGLNACSLHYLDNNCICEDGQMVLMDVGAEYGGYCADMTRTVPVNGRFGERQRAVYDAVVKVYRDACDLLRPGTLHKEHFEEVQKMMDGALVDLKLISKEDIKNQDPKKPARKKYFMHGLCHHLGIDVHDVGPYHLPIEAGQVFTVEPGIYIREEKLGVRVEDDLLIGEDKNDNLMGNIPLDADEIEELMNP